MALTVAIVEDIDEIRDGLASVINSAEGFECSATYTSAEDALMLLPEVGPDVVLMDINLPGKSGIECVKELKDVLPRTQVIMLTVYEDHDKIYESIVAGATGYLIKNTEPQKILEAIKDVHAGGSPMSSQIARKVVGAFRKMEHSPIPADNLSKREEEILTYLSKGYRNKEIAERLFISSETVRNHLRGIYEKLQVRTRTEAVLKYFGRLNSFK